MINSGPPRYPRTVTSRLGIPVALLIGGGLAALFAALRLDELSAWARQHPIGAALTGIAGLLVLVGVGLVADRIERGQNHRLDA